MTTTTQIAEYSATEAALATLREKYATAVFDVSTSKGMQDAREARAELRTYRTSLEKMRQELKAPILERGRLLDSEAKRITAELLKLEEPIDTVIKKEEERKAAEKAAAEEAERQRIAAIQERISAIRNTAVTLAGADSVRIARHVVGLQSLEITLEDYAELTGEAMQARAQTLDQLNELHAAAVAREAERAELEKLRAEAAARERIAAEERAKEAAKIRAEQERIAAEQAAQQAELDRQRRELEEQQAAAERARQAEAEAKAKAERELAERKAREQFLREGPSADELVQLIAEHYQVEPDIAIGWLSRHTFNQLAA